MNDYERIENARNRVFDTANETIVLWKNNPEAMKTKATSVYRLTGKNQLKDILMCGYVRPRTGKIKGGHKNEVFWSKGSDRLFYKNNPEDVILEAPADKVADGQIGAISLDELTGIWQYNEEQKAFINRIDLYKRAYEELQHEDHHKGR